MSRLAIGTVQFGQYYGITNNDGQVQINEVREILKFAKINNINTLDTASNYGNSEDILGEVGVDGHHVITKTTSLKYGVNGVIKEFHNSLKKIKQAKVKGLLIHNIDEIEDKKFDILFRKINELKRQGLVEKIGFSAYTPTQLNYLLENFDFDLIQVPCNVFDDRFIKEGHLTRLKNKDIEIHARSVFLQGILLDFNNLSSYFDSWKDSFINYQEQVEESGLSLLEYSLNYVLNIKELDKVLVGVNHTEQLHEIMKSANKNVDLKPFVIDDINLLNPSLWKI